MDDLTKKITETNQKIIEALIDSHLHPMILQMMLNDIQHQISDQIANIPQEAANDNTDV